MTELILLLHLKGDGMVERFNRSILQMLRCYIDQEDDWHTIGIICI